MKREKLEKKLRAALDEDRFRHTLGVSETAVGLAEIFGADKEKAELAGMLHDCAKCLPLSDMQKAAAEALPDDEMIASKALLHSAAGMCLAKKEYGVEDPEVLGAIRWHTTGRVGMTVFESIIYLADYIEETRTYDDCIALRSYFWDRIRNGEDKTAVLTDAMIYSFDITVGALVKDGARIDPDTVRARNYFLTLKKKAQTN